MPAGNAFGFIARIDGLALETNGLVYEYNGTSTELVTPIGIELRGLAIGQADFWHYADNPGNPNWVYADL